MKSLHPVLTIASPTSYLVTSLDESTSEVHADESRSAHHQNLLGGNISGQGCNDWLVRRCLYAHDSLARLRAGRLLKGKKKATNREMWKFGTTVARMLKKKQHRATSIAHFAKHAEHMYFSSCSQLTMALRGAELKAASLRRPKKETDPSGAAARDAWLDRVAAALHAIRGQGGDVFLVTN